MMNDDHLLHGSVISDTVTDTNFDSFRLLFKQLLKTRSAPDNKECLECTQINILLYPHFLLPIKRDL